MIALIKYHIHLYFKSGRFLVLFLLWTFALFLVFYDKNSSLSGNMLILLSVLYVCMAMVGYFYMKVEQNEMAADQVMIFHTKSMLYYNLSKIVFLYLLSLIMSMYGGGVTVLWFLLWAGTAKGVMIFGDWLTFIAALWLFACVGAMQGAMFHPRLILNKTLSLYALMGTVLLTFIKLSVLEKVGSIKVFLQWLLPPNNEIMQYFGGINDNKKIGLLLFQLALYNIILLVIQLTLLERKKY